MSPNLKRAIIEYLRMHGPSGGEKIRSAIGYQCFGDTACFGRNLFRELMSQMVTDGLVADRFHNYRHTFSLIEPFSRRE